MYGYIYKVTNLITKRIYVGQKRSSIFLGTRYLGSGVLIRKSVAKYGKENFSVELLCWCESKEDLDIQERYWIHHLNSRDKEIGYNLAEGGESSSGGMFRGHSHSEETREKIARGAALGNKRRKEHGYIAKAPNKGTVHIHKENQTKVIALSELEAALLDGWRIADRTARRLQKLELATSLQNILVELYPKKSKVLSAEHRKKIGDAARGHIVTEEMKQKIREKNQHQVPENKGKIRIYNSNNVRKYILPEELDSYLACGWFRH